MEEVSKIKLLEQYKGIYKNIIINNINITNTNNNNESMKRIKESLGKTHLVIKKYLSKLNKNNTKDTWIYCGNNCKIIRKLFEIEMNSTIFILNCIANSLITINKSKVYFEISSTDIDKLTGLWDNDHTFFDLKIMNINTDEITGKGKFTSEEFDYKKSRLIMGFGPSGSGKTYCARIIIDILSRAITDYPKSFLSIDGDIYRERSFIYQYILLVIKDLKFTGLKNLVLSGISLLYTSLFDSGKPKKKIYKYLNYLKNKNTNTKTFSLYVPETSAGCITDCYSAYKKYIDLTGDEKWTHLLIYQHLNNESCPYKLSRPGYQCKGCIETGKGREILEGKEYSMDILKWELSMNNAQKQRKKTEGIKLSIHNSGGYSYRGNITKSLIIDYTPLENNNLSIISSQIKELVNVSSLSTKTFNNFDYIHHINPILDKNGKKIKFKII